MSAPSHPLCCAVFGCNAWASFGFGQVRGEPGAGLWVCGSPLHRAWAIGVLEARKRLSPAVVPKERSTKKAPERSHQTDNGVVGPKPAPAKPPSLFDEVQA